MPTWAEIQEYAREKYQVDTEADPAQFTLVVSWEDGRSQTVFVRNYQAFDQDWLELVSPVCKEEELSPRAALRKSNAMPVGALAINRNNYYVVQYAVRLASMDMEEFEVPLRLIARQADGFELDATAEDLM